MKTYTRIDYLGGACTHDQYYDQLVTPQIKEIVKNSVGLDRIKKSNDPHFNDIPLLCWDRFYHHNSFRINEEFKRLGDSESIAGIVCVAKAAARQLKQN